MTILLLLAGPPALPAQTIEFPAAAAGDEAEVARAIPGLAAQAIGLLQEEPRDPYLDALFRLQLVAGRYQEAVASIQELRTLRRAGNAQPPALLFAQYEVFARAQAANGASPGESVLKAAREVLSPLDDRTALRTLFAFGTSLDRVRGDWLKAVEELKGKRQLELPEALRLIRLFQVQQAFQVLAPRAAAITAEDEARRYVIEKDVLVKTPDGTLIAAMVVRPRSTQPLPTLLGFTVYANDDWSFNDARNAAAAGYAGVVAYTRGKGRSPSQPIPFEHDGDDARAVIEWIARQPWSDRRVGMYGGSYNGFAQWAAAKKLPKELKALMTSATAAPGIDVPMQGNVFVSFMVPWPFYVTNTKFLDEEGYGNSERWESLNRSWYQNGRAYRDLDKIDGQPNPIFRTWLDHPTYDAYWQKMIPYKEEFASIQIPVLATTGYFDGGQVGVLYYFQEHTRYNPKADHTMVIGPFEHLTMQTGVPPVVQGYEVDPVARIDLQELRQQWFDFIFKGGEKPALLRDKVNYQVLGANEWKHAPTLEAMANGSLRFHLDAAQLKGEAPAPETSRTQTVDFKDRSDADYKPAELSLTKALDTHNGLAFVSDVITEPTEVSGLFSGKLDFRVNKKDFDFSVVLYEQMANGDFLQLAYHLGRASHAKDRTHRQLLTPGERQTLSFRAERITSRKLQPGSRLAVVLVINKQPDLQINYGTGKDVSDETIQDAGDPLQIEWFSGSFIEVPVWR